jgi:endonuclease G
MEEIQDTLRSQRGREAMESMGLEGRAASESLDAFAEGREAPVDLDDQLMFEAIVMRKGRPSFLIQNNKLVIPASEGVWSSRLKPFLNAIEGTLKSVGRVEVKGHPDYEWLGTGWLAAPDIVVTNRHVAREFARAAGSGFVFRPGLGNRNMTANIDFKEELDGTDEASVDVDAILYVAGDGAAYPDIAFLKLKSGGGRDNLILAANSKPKDKYVGVIGYPARDDRRNDPDAARDIFRDIYEKKRFAPGEIQSGEATTPMIFEHNCSSLGGNSGSAIIDVSNGEVLGLHFGGRFEKANYAVRAEVINQYLTRIQSSSGGMPPLVEAPAANPEDYADREGYDPQFLGQGDDLFVDLPQVTGPRKRDVQRQTTGPHKNSDVLKYTHFSICMCKSRRLPFYTAVNIDGDSLQRPRRGRDVWKFDPRIPEAAQVGNDSYANNKLDRGHQVRRLDPVWGDEEEAKLAELDTFHFTNSCPQHARLNQGKQLWAGLEDYLLDNTDQRNLRVSIFTGPVLGERDLDYRDIQIPQEYWKVAVNVRTDGKLSASGYLLSQGQFMDDLEFAFGPYRTFQLPIAAIAEKTGLSFGDLSDYDALGKIEGPSAVIPLDSLESIVLF